MDQHGDGDHIRDFVLLRKLGSGSFGTVWKALSRKTGQEVAIKMIDLEQSDEDIMELQKEIALLKSCDTRFVTEYHECFVYQAQLCIVMELMAGGSVVDLAGSLSEAQIARICKDTLTGLEYLHSQGRIHRDIKAANVLIGAEGTCKLADLGVAAQVSSQRSQRHTFVGTPFWMAPEVIEQAGYDTRADIWSLGITAIELATGTPPLTHLHPMRAIFHIPKNPPPSLPSCFSAAFQDFVGCCLRRDPRTRPAARELLSHRFLNAACDPGALVTVDRKISSLPVDKLSKTIDANIATLRPSPAQPKDSWGTSWPDARSNPAPAEISALEMQFRKDYPEESLELVRPFLRHIEEISCRDRQLLEKLLRFSTEQLDDGNRGIPARTVREPTQGRSVICPEPVAPISRLLYQRWLEDIQRRWRGN
ncbi:hypothetical protein PYCC9005_001648 [Savitreella phatthalungensis]